MLHFNRTTQTLFHDGKPLGKLKGLTDYDRDAATIVSAFNEDGWEEPILDPIPPRHGSSFTEMHMARVRRACEMLNRCLKQSPVKFAYCGETQTIQVS